MKNKVMKKLVAIAICGAMALTGFGSQSAEAAENTKGYDFDLDIDVNNGWYNGQNYYYQMSMTLTNEGSNACSSWTVDIDLESEISLLNSWCGDFSTYDGTLTISNAAWNGYITSGQNAGCGFIVMTDEEFDESNIPARVTVDDYTFYTGVGYNTDSTDSSTDASDTGSNEDTTGDSEQDNSTGDSSTEDSYQDENKDDTSTDKSGTTEGSEGTNEGTSTQDTTSSDVTIDPSQLSIYIPQELSDNDFNSSSSKWCYARSKQSDHFICFWEAGFGSDPNSSSVSSSMRVDVDDLLAKAETFYQTNVEELGMVDKSCTYLSKYKMEIFILYQTDWLATGSGYDNTIGALWVNPSTCQPVGAVIAHEIGHSFQYQVYCDKLLAGQADDYSTGFRYTYNSGMGNSVWEQCAEWQAWQDYPSEAYTWYYKDLWKTNSHRSFENEWDRYQSYWFFYAVKALQGDKAVANVWRNAVAPEDFIAAYTRLYCNNNTSELNDDLYYYASHVATFDFDTVRDLDTSWLDMYSTTLYSTGSANTYQVAYADCPDEAGFNVIKLDPSDYNGTVKIKFSALAQGAKLASSDPGTYYNGEDGTTVAGTKTTYNKTSGVTADHRYGFVAYLNDGSRVYSDCYSGSGKTVSFKIPDNTKYLYFVVVGGATEHHTHTWNNDESDDLMLPYQITYVK